MARYGVRPAAASLGIVYLWFGLLKLLPGHSPLQDLVGRTVLVMTFGLVPPTVSIPVLAFWECLIGLGFLSGPARRLTLVLFFVQMPGTLTPMLFFPHETFIRFPYEPSLEGQYIIKNLVLISAGIVIGATMRGGRIVHHSGRPGVTARVRRLGTWRKKGQPSAAGADAGGSGVGAS